MALLSDSAAAEASSSLPAVTANSRTVAPVAEDSENLDGIDRAAVIQFVGAIILQSIARIVGETEHIAHFDNVCVARGRIGIEPDKSGNERAPPRSARYSR